MLDHLILSKLNKKGRISYFVGQFILLGIELWIVLGLLGMNWDDDGYVFFIVLAIVTVVIWGAICIKIWPADKTDEKESQTE